MPILDNEGEVIGVAQIVNKISSDQTEFSTADEEVISISTAESFEIYCNLFYKITHNQLIGILLFLVFTSVLHFMI